MTDRKYTVLIIDDEKNTRETLGDVIETMGHHPLTTGSGESGMKIVREEDVDVILTDLKLPRMDGLEILNEIKQYFSSIPVILITGHETIETAVQALKAGAQDYLVKPLDLNRIRANVEKALQWRNLILEKEGLQERLKEKDIFARIIGQSKSMHKVFNVVRQVAKTNATVLITGDSGTGKELVADAIYNLSQRVNRPFIKVNMAALPKDMIESELFGHEKGAFTGAIRQKKGRFELADGGSMFLDEVSEMPLEVQVKLLRVLQEQEFERVGGTETIKTDIRLIAATNQNLKSAMDAGIFREDLYYRLNVVLIDLPSLKERKEDIPALVKYHTAFYSEQMNKHIDVEPETVTEMLRYNWPGNVRELKNVIERMAIISPGGVLRAQDLPSEILNSPEDLGRSEMRLIPGMTMDEIEKQHITVTLAKFEGNKRQTAKTLGIGLKTLYRKIEKYSIQI